MVIHNKFVSRDNSDARSAHENTTSTYPSMKYLPINQNILPDVYHATCCIKSLGVIHKGRPHKGEGVCHKRTPVDGGRGELKANVDVRKIFKKCQIEDNLLKKCLIIDDILQIVVHINH